MSELRQNPATKEWVIISTERAKRPEEFSTPHEELDARENVPDCPFCEGNEALTPPETLSYRAFGTKPNTPGWWIRITPNKFAAVMPDGSLQREKIDEFYRHMGGFGEHEVLIEHPKHNMTIATMEEKQVEEIFLAYRERYTTLSQDPRIEQVLIFKNHGAGAGTSVRHPHSQIIATPVTPQHTRHRIEEAMRFYDDNGECVYCTMLRKELEGRSRIVLQTENFLAFEPFASRSPFETWILPIKHDSSFDAITPQHTKELAYIMKHTLGKMFYGLKNPDYNYIIHSSPCHEKNVEYYHWHIQILPRITSMAGFELGSGIYINTVIPEEAAKFLRDAKSCLQ